MKRLIGRLAVEQTAMKRAFIQLLMVQIIAWAPAVAAETKSVSPDGKWEFRLVAPQEAEGSQEVFVITKRGSAEPSTELTEEASGTFAASAHVVWAPDSQRFAFNYQPGFRVRTVQLYQLDGSDWRELDAPDSDASVTKTINRSTAAQRKELGVPPAKIGRPISDVTRALRWLGANSVLLYVGTQETFEIKNELEEVSEACLVTLKFDATGDWKVTRTRLLTNRKTADLNEAERAALARLDENLREENQ